MATFSVASVAAGAPNEGETTAAARGFDRGDDDLVLTFEPRDWERLVAFADGSAPARMPPSSRPTAILEQRLLEPPISTPAPPASMPASLPLSGPIPEAFASKPSLGSFRAATRFASGELAHARVLLVDDDDDIRDVVGAMLEAVGLTVDAVDSAEEALDRLDQDFFDMAVLDWSLPGMTGLDLCKRIRNDAELAGLPILFLTAHAASQDLVEAFASGADDYVVKPFRAPELGARIFSLLRRARGVAAGA